MKNVQISKELFLALLHYHLDGEDEYADEIVQGLEQKQITVTIDTTVTEAVSYTHLTLPTILLV